MLDTCSLTQLHDEYNQAAHQQQAPPATHSSLQALILAQHTANFNLWHAEDEARTPRALPALIVRAKQNIDRLNQQRNDLVEQIDLALLAANRQNEVAPLHSETPGLIVDRLSILSLKIFHTAEESNRQDSSEEHRSRNRERLAILSEQREDLSRCLNELCLEISAGTRRFKLYRQLKMYNDPDLNPVIYGATKGPDA